MDIEQIQRFRTIRRAIYGSTISILFYEPDIVPAQGTYCLVSRKITNPFIVEKVGFDFIPGTAKTLKAYYLVSDEPTLDKTGYNVLADYSTYPFLVGDGRFVEANVDPKEFEDKYVKVFVENKATTTASIDAVIKITTYPKYK